MLTLHACLQWVGATAGAHAADGKHSNGAAQNGSTKRQLHVGQQAVDYRQDHMQVLLVPCSPFSCEAAIVP